MRCNLRTVNSSLRTVSEVHGPYELYGPTNDMQFTDREPFYTDRIWRSRSVRTVKTETSLPVRYGVGVLDNPRPGQIKLAFNFL